MSSNHPRSRVERGPSGPLFFALVFLFFAGSASGQTNITQWIRSPEAYFATAEERAQWDSRVLTPADAQKFIEEFRRRRGEQFVKDINSRIEFADKQFAIGKRRGAETERGRVFMLLGPPNEQRRVRSSAGAQSGGSDPNTSFQNNNLERQSVVETEWIYKSDRLPKELGVPELKVRFQTNFGRGQETIENPGLVEPYLKRTAEFISTRYAQQARGTAASAPAPATGSTPAVPAGPDPLWSAPANANGAILTGETYISPTDRPMYAVSLYIPKEAGAFTQWKSGLLVSLIRDASGATVVSNRQQVDLLAYDGAGNRYVDRGFELTPGRYEAVFALYSPEGSTMLANWREQFEVFPASQTRASKLLLTSRIDTLQSQEPFDAFTYVATKYAVRGDRRFTLADKIAFFTVVQNPTGETPKLMQRMTITKDGKPFFKSPVETSVPTQTGPRSFLVGTSFAPATFKAGKYNIELQLRDMNAPEGSDLRTKGHVVSADFEVIP